MICIDIITKKAVACVEIVTKGVTVCKEITTKKEAPALLPFLAIGGLITIVFLLIKK